jgi:acyl-CoA synthetase (AMP-forming)/AMP-acid ligase II
MTQPKPPDSPSPGFATLPDLIGQHARKAPDRTALEVGASRLSYTGLDAMMHRVASALQRAGLNAHDSIAICASSSIAYAAVFLGALRAGVVVAPLAPSSTASSLARMVQDAGARIVFTDASCATLVGQALAALSTPVTCISMDPAGAGSAPVDWLALEDWLAPEGAMAATATISGEHPFNIIYSSGTTGEPKGIVQSHGMRFAHIQRGSVYGYGPKTVTLLSTPLYSNTTLVVFIPTLAFGGTVVMMPKFDAADYLKLAESLRVTHTMLVPVQYQRLLARPDFDDYNLSSFQTKFCTSAPFSAKLKADVVKRWPGGLIEFYGMTEGGGTCILEAHLHPDKLHTVGKPALNHDIRLIDEDGQVVAPGGDGEVVGHSASMMNGYHGQPHKTREAEWYDAAGKRFIRTGDIGRFDADGFLTLFDRRKDMIISGGFNIYPSDLEGVLMAHPDVQEVAVVGVPSEQWGETPVAFVVPKPVAGGDDGTADADADHRAAALVAWANGQLGKTQRITALIWVAELPRSAIGKVLKRELRDQYASHRTPLS